jgi:hypothetical protein
MDEQEITERILGGDFDESLLAINKAITSRLRAVRSLRTSADFVVGDKVIFNERCGDSVLRGMHGMVTGREGAAVKVVMGRPFPPYAERVDGRWEPVEFTVPPSAVDRL